jgi:hypothetical protein
MTDRTRRLRHMQCRLVIIDACSLQILTSNAHCILPRTIAPADSRIAEALTETIRRRFGLCTIQLALLSAQTESSSCAVFEIVRRMHTVPEIHSFRDLDAISSQELTEQERAQILRILAGEAHELGRFARLGWIYELFSKTGISSDRRTLPVIRHLNEGVDFSLLDLRFADGQNLWFKAVGEPNAREFALTQELARRFPRFLPKIVATVAEWNGWMMEEVKGTPLDHVEGIKPCKHALTGLAILQRESCECINPLSALGAKDWSCRRIRSLLGQFFEDARRAMLAQTSVRSKALSHGELSQLKEDVEAALCESIEAGIPETLLHGDIGHGNILATLDGPVFLDWAETAIGHPFFSAEHLLADLARSSSMIRERQTVLRHHYANRWRGQLPKAAIGEAIALSPAMGAFVYAFSAWEANRDRPDPEQAWPLIRSLLRRTRRELHEVQERLA